MPELSAGNWIALVSALTALISVIIGPLVTWRVAKKRIRASVVSENRQEWINTLRDSISEFQAKAKIATVEAKLASDSRSSSAADPDSHDDAMKAITLISNRIKLMVNPNEEDHARLVTCIDELLKFCSEGDPNDTERHQELQNRITSIGQQILKREWERVKKGE